MAFPQLTGRTGPGATATGQASILVAVVGLAAILAVAAWRLFPSEPASAAQVAALPAVPPALAEREKPILTDDHFHHLSRAEQQLETAAEQLVTAQRLLIALAPELNRNYLQLEKRRAENAWAACDAAHRAIEQARGDIKLVSNSKE